MQGEALQCRGLRRSSTRSLEGCFHAYEALWAKAIISRGGLRCDGEPVVAQAVASMVMGLRPTEVMDSDFAPINPASGASWRYPPTLLMAASNDQEEIIDLVNHTASFLEGQVRARMQPAGCFAQTYTSAG